MWCCWISPGHNPASPCQSLSSAILFEMSSDAGWLARARLFHVRILEHAYSGVSRTLLPVTDPSFAPAVPGTWPRAP